MEKGIASMRKMLQELLPKEGVYPVGIEGVGIFRTESAYKKKPNLYHPQIILLAQGKKNIYLGEKMYVYDPYHYYVQTVPLPVECEAVIEDSKPMLGMVIRIDPKIIGEILFEMESDPPMTRKASESLYDAAITEEILDAVNRLLGTLRSKNDTNVLGPVFLKEVLYKILTGEHGASLQELAHRDRGFYQMARVINTMHENYAQPFEMQDLAREAGMSTTAFYAMFKNMTSTSPLQYVKNIRLHKAKELLQQEGEKANVAAMRVGYESPSQFSREYKRCFGVAPSQDRQAAGLY